MANLPPEPPMPPDGSGSGEYKRWKKAHADWYRMWQQAEDAAANDPQAQEERAIAAAGDWSDREFDSDVKHLTGYSVGEIMDAFREVDPSDMGLAERAAYESLQRAQGAWFDKAAKQRKAIGKVSKARKTINKRVKKKQGWCVVVAILGLAYAALLAAVIESGAHDLWASIVSR